MKNVKKILTVLVLPFVMYSCSTDGNLLSIEEEAIIDEEVIIDEEEQQQPPVVGDILFTVEGHQTAVFNDAEVFFSNPSDGWTTIHTSLEEGDIVSKWFTFRFEGNTPGEYERYDENVQGNYSNGNSFYWVYDTEVPGGYYFNGRDFKVESMLVTAIGENVGDQVAGSFSGLVEVDGVDIPFSGEFDFLIE